MMASPMPTLTVAAQIAFDDLRDVYKRLGPLIAKLPNTDAEVVAEELQKHVCPDEDGRFEKWVFIRVDTETIPLRVVLQANGRRIVCDRPQVHEDGSIEWRVVVV
jgi:hypothetical protein